MDTARKAAIVTGASRGIGKGIALALAERGYDLFITHLDEAQEADDVARTAAECYKARCEVLKCDLTDEGAAKLTVDRAIEAFGSVHVLVNNAGVTIFGKITEFPVDKMNYLYNLNFRAPMLLTKYGADHMIASGIRGAIISIASSRGERAYPPDAIYGGLKAALIRSSQSIALELAPHGIRVNTVGPGAIQVRDEHQAHYENLGRRIPLGRGGKPDDIGRAVAWLASEDAAYITGVNLRIDGGLILPGMPERVQQNSEDGWGKI